MFFMQGHAWQIGAFSVVVSSILAGCSLVSYSAILVDISTEDERDRVSSRGWAFGYLGGGTLLLLNLVLVLGHDAFGIDKGWRSGSRCSRRRCGGRRSRSSRSCGCATTRRVHVVPESGGLLQRSFGQLWTTLRELRGYPMTLTFLLAYLFYNDGIQTVIYAASTYGSKQLGFDQSVLIATILLIQFVAFGGALFFGRLAARYGAYRLDPVGHLRLDGDRGGRDVPARASNVALFLVVGVAIGVVLGGTQALSRSFFSLLIPRGREGEYFALYNACERGTSWFGTLLFGLVFQVTGSYRPAIFALDRLLRPRCAPAPPGPARGIREAGNAVPRTSDLSAPKCPVTAGVPPSAVGIGRTV